MLPARHRDLVSRALAVLGIDDFVLAIHDASFPGDVGDDAGHGSPASRGGDRFFNFARTLGFRTIQLGPAGQTSFGNASPYDATAFSRNFLSIALRELAEPEGPFGSLLSEGILAKICSTTPEQANRVHHRHAFVAHEHALHEAFLQFQQGRDSDLAARIDMFVKENAGWLEAGEEHAFRQYIAHAQHSALRERLAKLDLALHGDLHIGLSVAERSRYAPVFLADYVMGAPPSRTNPDGQPWGYPVFDPEQYCDADTKRPGAALRMLVSRIDKMFSEYDGIRIDHPHGLVCPWVYRASGIDPHAAVRTGARLFSSPNLADHPALGRYSIVTTNQVCPELPRYAENWVNDLTPEQVDRYAILFDAIVASAERHGRDRSRLVCEVLSTMPFPLQRILERHGLGRFRVIQKANIDDPHDVYRTENACPADWVMLGTHDTPPAFRVAHTWCQTGIGLRWAGHLAQRLCTNAADIPRQTRTLHEGGAGSLVHALFADMCTSRARGVMVFWADLFGLLEVYNTPGTVNDENWSLRVPPNFEQFYLINLARKQALNLPEALILALRAQTNRPEHELISALQDLSLELQALGRALGEAS